MSIKSLVQSLLECAIKKTIHCVNPTGVGVVSLSVTPEIWKTTIAPFDGWAQIKIENVQGITGISLRSIGTNGTNYLGSNVPTLQALWGATCLPIKKGDEVRCYLNGSGANQTLNLYPNSYSAS